MVELLYIETSLFLITFVPIEYYYAGSGSFYYLVTFRTLSLFFAPLEIDIRGITYTSIIGLHIRRRHFVGCPFTLYPQKYPSSITLLYEIAR